METHTPSAFGELLRRYRVAAVLTQEELAARAGLSARAVSDLERGVKSRPHAYTVRRLSEALGLEGPARVALEAARGRGTGAAGTPVGASGGVAAPLPRGTGPPPLVGRTCELALLERHLVGEGPPLLLLAGEPGIGKSRLLRAAAQRATGHGWRVLVGGCQRRRGQEPFAPLLEALESYLTCRGRSELQADLRGCAWLVRLLPELAAGPIEPLPAWTLSPQQERRLIDKAVGRLLANVAGPAGTLLLLDDLQWAGTDALELLVTLVRAATEPPVRVIGAYRDTEVQADDPLAGVLADLAQAGLACQHTLGPLTAEEAWQLLDDLLDDCLADAAEVRERVVQRAGGVPFYLVSYAQGLRVHGPESPAVEAVPWDVAQGVRQRVAALPGPARAVLGAAAVIGRVVPAALLAVVADHGEREVLTALDMASRARLLIEKDQTYQFAHDLIREVVEADVGTARRLVLHRRIAEALEREPGERVVEVLAYHYGRAGMPEQAVLYLEQAGDRAWAQHANAAAEGYYRELVARVERLGRALDAARAREKLGAVLTTAGWYDAALRVLEHAAETYRAREDLESLARVTGLIGLVYQNRGPREEGVARLQALLEHLEVCRLSHSHGLVKLYVALPDLLVWWCGRYREGLVTSERAVALARTLGDEQLLAEALAAHGLAHLAVGHLIEARRALEEAIPLAESAGDLVESLPKALWLLSIVCLRSGELDRSTLCCERELAVTERSGHAARTAAATALRGLIAYVGGDWARARRDGEQALVLGHQIGTCWADSLCLTVLGLVSYGEGRWDTAAYYLEESVMVGKRVGHLSCIHFAPSVLAECDLLEGHPERARARLAPLLEKAGPEEVDVSLLLPPYAWAHLELGDVVAAAAIVGRAIANARARNDRLNLVDALRVQALVAIRQGQWHEVVQALEEGITLAHSMPYPYGAARLLHVSGGMHLQKGELGPARERLEAALAIFRRLGARKDIERVEQAIAKPGRQHSGDPC
jgi:tetratricopeptide (TPR) repeat protein/DNA-binding XRE family transcriptional regulator